MLDVHVHMCLVQSGGWWWGEGGLEKRGKKGSGLRMRRCRDSARQPITFPLALTPFLATEGLLHICAGVQCVCLSPHTRRATQISGGVCGVSVRVCVRACVCIFQSA